MGMTVSIGTGRVLSLLLGLAAIETGSACGRGSAWFAPAADLPTDAPASAQPLERAGDPRPPDGVKTPWIEGKHYDTLEPAVAQLSGSGLAGRDMMTSVTAPPGTAGPPGSRIIVAEFFLYACRHCYELESPLREWLSRRPGQVEFVRIPVMWRSPLQDAHARLFYTLRELGREDLGDQVFVAIHRHKQRLAAQSEAESLQLQLAFARANGIEARRFASAWRSAAVEKNLQLARQLTRACRIESVPAMVVNGKYLSTAGRAGGKPELLRLVSDFAAQELARAR